jgi:hypothetical protein
LPDSLAAKAVEVPDSIDTRIWPAPRRRRRAEDPLRLLYLAARGDTRAFGFVLAAVSATQTPPAAPIELLVVDGPVAPLRQPWVCYARSPETAGTYPLRAAWLSQKGPFDLALLPPGVEEGGLLVAALEHAALGAATLICENDRNQATVPESGTVFLAPPVCRTWADILRNMASELQTTRNAIARKRDALLMSHAPEKPMDILVERLQSLLHSSGTDVRHPGDFTIATYAARRDEP